MNLKDYLKENGLTQGAFAINLEVSRNYVNMLCQGSFRPSSHLAHRIVALTGGQVTFSELRSLPSKREADALGKTVKKEKTAKVEKPKEKPWFDILDILPEHCSRIWVKGPNLTQRECIARRTTKGPCFMELAPEDVKGWRQIEGVTHWRPLK